MSGPLLFCPAFRPGACSDSIRSSSARTSRKRKRGENSIGSGAGVAIQDRPINEGKPRNKNKFSTSPLTKLRQETTTCADDKPSGTLGLPYSQGLADSGLDKEEETAEDSWSSQSNSDVSDNNLAPLTSPSLFRTRPISRRTLSSGTSRSDGPRRQHLAAVLAILHRCLLQGDYVRAGRAWALLLRSEVNGQPMDVRSQGRWGIGAEILLQQGLSQQPDGLRGDQGSTFEPYDELSTTNGKPRFRGILQPAQDYYDRLIVQYPYRKASANAVGPLDFYPALFSMRIFSEQYQHEERIKKFQEIDSDNESKSKNETSPATSSILHEITEHDCLPLQKFLLNHGKEMANHLDELLSSPPYSDDIRLRNLRSMIGLCTADLLVNSA